MKSVEKIMVVLLDGYISMKYGVNSYKYRICISRTTISSSIGHKIRFWSFVRRPDGMLGWFQLVSIHLCVQIMIQCDVKYLILDAITFQSAQDEQFVVCGVLLCYGNVYRVY